MPEDSSTEHHPEGPAETQPGHRPESAAGRPNESAPESPIGQPPVIFGQDGARLHYALPVALHRAGLLQAMYTDWYRDGSRRASLALAIVRLLAPASARRLEQRYCEELAAVPVYCLQFTGPLFILACRAIAPVWLRQLIIQPWWQAAARRGPLAHPRGGGTVYFTFTHNLPPATARKLKTRGYRLVVDQPLATAAEVARQQQCARERWPHWEIEGATVPPAVAQIAASAAPPAAPAGDAAVQELDALVDHWTCASGYVHQSLVEVGVRAEKISVLPYPVDVRELASVDRSGHTGPVVVGFVGVVNLRKGAPWFLEVARRLEAEDAKFVMVGPIQLSEFGRAEMGRHVDLVGAVPRSDILPRLAGFDIFLFPSTCEGSAGAVMEAMATGLPIVTTPNTGSIVRDGVDGFIRPYDRSEELAACVQQLVADQGLRLDMGRSARRNAESHDINAYSVKIAALMRRVVAGPVGPGSAAAPYPGPRPEN